MLISYLLNTDELQLLFKSTSLPANPPRVYPG